MNDIAKQRNTLYLVYNYKKFNTKENRYVTPCYICC